MSSPTSEQSTAIKEEGKNIIVSAGAGSGKTFVLKERVLRKVKSGTHVDDLIILTFTNNAAQEMKNRIRKILKENNIADADLVDSAYITTFDSFAQSLVKKYNYLLNISKDFSIIDESIVQTEIANQVDDIFEELYKNKDTKFEKMINNLCYKNDKDLRTQVAQIYASLGNITNKTEFLNTYIDKYYDNKYVEEKLNLYISNIFNELGKVLELLEIVKEEYIGNNEFSKVAATYEILSNASSLDELKDNFTTSIDTCNDKNYNDVVLAKRIKSELDDYKETFTKRYLKYYEKDLKDQYISTKEDVEVIISILKELDKRITAFKEHHNAYEFSDISFKAIELVKNNPDIAKDIRDHTEEIMIDEYQDTNDIQEEFISYIQNNNIYMVGDVKQSIYGFRNAKPMLFKEKYDNYAKGNGGMKIDLTANFRSREEVIYNINYIFSLIMFDNVGGAAYKDSHCMGFGKTKYNELKDSGVDYNLSLLNYELEKDYKKYTKDEIEAFIIAQDIKKKMSEHRNTFHEVGKEEKMIPMTYKDFCVLVDKSKNFDLIKQVLEYNGIPATIDKSSSVKQEEEIYILKNLITLLIKIHTNKEDAEFKHAFTSIARSYIIDYNDNEIYDNIINNTYKETNLYKDLKELSKDIDTLSNKEILYKLVEKFDIINKTISTNNISARITKLEYFINNAESLNKFGFDIYSMNDFFKTVLDSDLKLEIPAESSDKDAVKIMTIHGSKGLEYNYVYMPYLDSSFFSTDKQKVKLNEKYGIITKFNDEGIDSTFMDQLKKQEELKDIISEKIRLFYVAITRAKENFIMISQFNDKLINDNDIDEYDLLKCKSFTDLITLLKDNLAKYTTKIDINDLGLSKNYKTSEEVKYQEVIDSTSETIKTTPLNIEKVVLESKSFSKPLTKLMTKELRDTLDYGTLLHASFEAYNFQKDNLSELNISDEMKDNIRNFLKHDEVKNISNAITYKEHPIRFEKDGSIFNGIIDLLVEYDDHFDIIDYKTNNIDSEEYDLQLQGYKDYIENTYNKTTNIYLYSIKKDIFKKI